MKNYPKYFLTLLFIFLNAGFLISCRAQAPVFYGMTMDGGNNDAGTIVMFNPATNKDSVMWSFGSGSDGSYPHGNLFYDANNRLFYGMTQTGGNNSINSVGAMISFNPATDNEEVVWSFTNDSSDGRSPDGSLAFNGSNGLFYGMTVDGGSYQQGAIITFNPNTDKDSLLWSFGSGNDGAGPHGSLVADESNGLFYGLTFGGGNNDYGAIISFNPYSNSESMVWSFGNNKDGTYPSGDLVFDASSGLFYGMTFGGGSKNYGTIFSFNPSTNEDSVLWNFGNGTDGGGPDGSLVFNSTYGLYYGMTSVGGSNNAGAIISFNPVTNKETVLWSFGNAGDGNTPFGNLVFDANTGLYYGMTNKGGSNGKGVIISFNPYNLSENVVWNFGDGIDGQNPQGSLILYPPSTNGINKINTTPTLTIFPNPTNWKLVVGGWKLEIVGIEVYNSLGQKVFQLETQNTQQEIDLSNQSSGIYLARVMNKDGGVVERKVVKE